VPRSAQRWRRIDLGTLAGLHAHPHRLDAYCPRCARWAKFDRAAMMDAKVPSGVLPPVAPRISYSAGVIVRDGDCNAL
jgi:hypothetical protein